MKFRDLWHRWLKPCPCCAGESTRQVAQTVPSSSVTARSRPPVSLQTIPYLGRALNVVAEPERTRVHRSGDTLLTPTGRELRPALERWYRRMARVEIGMRLDRACEITGTRYLKLTVRDQRTRWASCSHSGTMSFNWRLLLGPEPILDYVVWHEVCHLREMNHSRRFWALVAEHCPDYRERAAWLRVNAAALVL
jgi:predicted metal-dependent hydrolase